MATPGRVTRRRFARVGALGVAGLSVPSAAPAGHLGASRQLSSAPLLRLELHLRTDVRAAHSVATVCGGEFRGPRVAGTVVDGGAWFIRRPDGSDEVNLQATLRTCDGETVTIRSRGLIETTPDHTRSIRVTPVFETSSTRYAWVNRLVTVGVGHQTGDRVQLEVFAVD